jgi:hypothetical protein
MAAPRYFLDEEPALEALLDGFLSRLSKDLRAQAWSEGATLVLGGGYGRGEGGVFRAGDGAAPTLYNDLEFYLFFERPIPAEAKDWVARWEREGTVEIGIEVEFKLLAASALQATEPTMFFHDLLAGHRLVAGSQRLLASAPERMRDAAALPLEEANRLLFNRGSGLLFARWRLEEGGAAEAGFVERNHAKAKLSLADAVLAASGRHHPSVVERARRVQAGGFPTPAGWARLQAWHREGVDFKLRPRHRRSDPAALVAVGRELEAAWLEVFLWVEEKRLGRTFASPAAYSEAGLRLFPRSSAPKNLALHLRDRLRRGGALPGWTDYPRAALLRCLVCLLAGGGAEAAGRRLGVSEDLLRSAYRRWWGLYN